MYLSILNHIYSSYIQLSLFESFSSLLVIPLIFFVSISNHRLRTNFWAVLIDKSLKTYSVYGSFSSEFTRVEGLRIKLIKYGHFQPEVDGAKSSFLKAFIISCSAPGFTHWKAINEVFKRPVNTNLWLEKVIRLFQSS